MPFAGGYRNAGSGDPGDITLTLHVMIGATGAVGTVVRGLGRGFRTPTRLGVGNYRIFLSDTWPLNSMLEFDGEIRVSTAAVLNHGYVRAEALNVVSATAPSIDIQWVDAAGAAVDPANGAKMCVSLRFTAVNV